MTGRNQGNVCRREPAVPPGMARLAALVTKAELVELLWLAFGIGDAITGCQRTDHDRLVALVRLVNIRRRESDPLRSRLDASKLNGPGVAELRAACGEAIRIESTLAGEEHP